MSATATAAILPLRALRRALGRVERALRPDGDVDAVATSATVTDAPVAPDPTMTQELLIPRLTDEPAATRASRQAQDYLAWRRHKLSRQLEDR